MRAALLYDTTALALDRPRLTGLAAATAGFYRAYLEHAPAGPLTVVPNSGEVTEAEIRDRLPTDREIRIVRRVQSRRLADPGTLFLPGPPLAPFAWERRQSAGRAGRQAGDGGYSLTGITHAMSTARALDAVRDLAAAPVQPWDALICTSTAIRDLVERVFEGQEAHLRDRFGAGIRTTRPMLPVIPLGIDPVEVDPVAGQTFRVRHGLAADTVAVLYLGRLSVHGKAHPVPMMRALAEARRRTDRPLALILAGWFHDKTAEQAFRETAAAEIPDVPLIEVDARDPAVKQAALSGADIFLSLVDNIQESFGLTPLEAMAAGLPVVVSDWDGYRDTVVDGETGFLVPTALPPAGTGAEFAWRRLTGFDDEAAFHARMSQVVAVDTVAAGVAIARLADDADLRRRMGAAGRVRVRAAYGWREIIRRYEELFAEQAAIRAAASPEAGNLPSATDPFELFAGFASLAGAERLRVSIVDPEAEASLARLADLPLAAVDPDLPDRARQVLQRLRDAAAEGLVLSMPGSDAPPEVRAIWRPLLWLAKLGIVRLERL